MLMKRHIPGLLSAALLLAGFAIRAKTALNDDDVKAYHQGVAQAVAQIPYRWGDWVGVDVATPPAALRLLRPNAMLSRRYQNRVTGQVCEVLLVHCSDTRDMLGHFPPVCYPAHGWETRAAIADTSNGRASMVYRFERLQNGQLRAMRITNFISIPGAGRVPDMSGLRRASEARWRHSLGAGQVQIIVDGGMSDIDRSAIVLTFEQMLSPALERIERWSP